MKGKKETATASFEYDAQTYAGFIRAEARDYGTLTAMADAFCQQVKLPDAADRIREGLADLHKRVFKGKEYQPGGEYHAGAKTAWDTQHRLRRRIWSDMGYKVQCNPTGTNKDQYSNPAKIERLPAKAPAANAKGKRPNVVQQMREVIKHLPPDQQLLHAWELLATVQRETGRPAVAAEKAADRCRTKVKAAEKKRKAS